MIFLGYSFAGYTDSQSRSRVASESVTDVTAAYAVFDDLHILRQITEPDQSIELAWDPYTLLFCEFNGSLLAGNVDYYLESVDMVRLKRRKEGELEWMTIWQQPVYEASDLSFHFLDFTARAGQAYEYVCVPVCGGVEGEAESFKITSEFDGLVIADGAVAFGSQFDAEVTQTRNSPATVVNTINRRYPYVIRNSANNYDSGTAVAFFAEYDRDIDDVDTDTAWDHRSELKDFLVSGTPKILKFRDGRMWLVSISSSQITDEKAGHDDLVHTSFEWTEIGDCDSSDDLYNANILTYAISDGSESAIWSNFDIDENGHLIATYDAADDFVNRVSVGASASGHLTIVNNQQLRDTVFSLTNSGNLEVEYVG